MELNKIKAIAIVASISILINSGISGIVGLCFWLAGMSFWATFGITFIAQTFIGGLWNSYQERRRSILMAAINAQDNLANSLQCTQLHCAYCQVSNEVDILIGKENSFECTACNQTNKVELTFTTMRITTPLQVNRPLADIFAKIDEATDEEHVKAGGAEKIGLEPSES